MKLNIDLGTLAGEEMKKLDASQQQAIKYALANVILRTTQAVEDYLSSPEAEKKYSAIRDDDVDGQIAISLDTIQVSSNALSDAYQKNSAFDVFGDKKEKIGKALTKGCELAIKVNLLNETFSLYLEQRSQEIPSDTSEEGVLTLIKGYVDEFTAKVQLPELGEPIKQRLELEYNLEKRGSTKVFR